MRNQDVQETCMYHYSSMIRRDYSLKQHKTVEYYGYYLDSDLKLVKFLKRSTQN